ncbi:MAG: glycosyltransferase [Patescibacteria group bacterium]|jgi:glycosyltransferase involved in cell wall biosynthesis
MKILLTNYHLVNYAGSELYTYELANELKALGHFVVVFTLFKGEVSQRIEGCGIPVVDNLEEIIGTKFDIIHAHHNVSALLARYFFPAVPMVYLQHGVLPQLEHLPEFDIGIAKYLAVSEEVTESMLKNKFVNEKDLEIIRNFTETGRFKPTKPVSKELKNVLVISNHYFGDHKGIIESACSKLGLNLKVIGLNVNSVWPVEEYINEADLVISLGKGVLQAMSCNRDVIVYDYNGGDGMLRQDNYYEIRKKNFSGRQYGIRYNADQLVKEMQKYDPRLAVKNREIIEKEHCLENAAKRLVDIYRENRDATVDKKAVSQLRKLDFLISTFIERLKYNNEAKKRIDDLSKEINKIITSPSFRLAAFLHKLRMKIPGIKKIKNGHSRH